MRERLFLSFKIECLPSWVLDLIGPVTPFYLWDDSFCPVHILLLYYGSIHFVLIFMGPCHIWKESTLILRVLDLGVGVE